MSLLLDANALLHKIPEDIYWRCMELSEYISWGQPPWGVYEHKMVLVFDDFDSYRVKSDKTPSYKNNRRSAEKEIIHEEWINAVIKDVIALERAGFDVKFSSDGYEADDLIFTLATPDDYVLSSDKDLMFCEDRGAKTYIMNKGVFWRSHLYVKKYTPLLKHFRAYLALVGDASDNHKGKKGFGAKAFETLMTDFEDQLELKTDDDFIIIANAIGEEVETLRDWHSLIYPTLIPQ